jgi:hypothetical protein
VELRTAPLKKLQINKIRRLWTDLLNKWLPTLHSSLQGDEKFTGKCWCKYNHMKRRSRRLRLRSKDLLIHSPSKILDQIPQIVCFNKNKYYYRHQPVISTQICASRILLIIKHRHDRKFRILADKSDTGRKIHSKLILSKNMKCLSTLSRKVICLNKIVNSAFLPLQSLVISMYHLL